MSGEWVLDVFWPLMMALYFAYAVLRFSLKRYLSVAHEALYANLFGPFLGSSGSRPRAFFHFLNNREYLQIPDATLHRKCASLRRLYIACLAVFAFLLFYFAWHAITIRAA